MWREHSEHAHNRKQSTQKAGIYNNILRPQLHDIRSLDYVGLAEQT